MGEDKRERMKRKILPKFGWEEVVACGRAVDAEMAKKIFESGNFFKQGQSLTSFIRERIASSKILRAKAQITRTTEWAITETGKTWGGGFFFFPKGQKKKRKFSLEQVKFKIAINRLSEDVESGTGYMRPETRGQFWRERDIWGLLAYKELMGCKAIRTESNMKGFILK